MCGYSSEGALPRSQHVIGKQDEADLVEGPIAVADDRDRDRSRLVEWVAIHPAGNRWERNRPKAALDRKLESGAIRATKKRRVGWTAAVDWAHRVDDVARSQPKARSDASLARWATNSGPNLWKLAAGFEQLRPGRTMNGAVDTASAEHLLVGGVHDGVDCLLSQITSKDFNPIRHCISSFGRPDHDGLAHPQVPIGVAKRLTEHRNHFIAAVVAADPDEAEIPTKELIHLFFYLVHRDG